MDWCRWYKGPWNSFVAKPLCWYEEPKFRTFFAEYRDVGTEVLSRRLTEPDKYGKIIKTIGLEKN